LENSREASWKNSKNNLEQREELIFWQLISTKTFWNLMDGKTMSIIYKFGAAIGFSVLGYMALTINWIFL
jgi:hypothetical protein